MTSLIQRRWCRDDRCRRRSRHRRRRRRRRRLGSEDFVLRGKLVGCPLIAPNGEETN